MRPFETEYEVAPGVLVHRTGGHTPGHSVVRLASGSDRLTFAGDAVFQVGLGRPAKHVACLAGYALPRYNRLAKTLKRYEKAARKHLSQNPGVRG
jgi:glyoxylase-like metal-dependent hydrolase (beta-lactamase superfamily II)